MLLNKLQCTGIAPLPPTQRMILPQMLKVSRLRNPDIHTIPSYNLKKTAIYKAGPLQDKFQSESDIMHNEGFTGADTTT